MTKIDKQWIKNWLKASKDTEGPKQDLLLQAQNIFETLLSEKCPKNYKIDIRGEICKIISEMLDNPDKYGIYPTAKCYDKLEAFISSL